MAKLAPMMKLSEHLTENQFKASVTVLATGFSYDVGSWVKLGHDYDPAELLDGATTFEAVAEVNIESLNKKHLTIYFGFGKVGFGKINGFHIAASQGNSRASKDITVEYEKMNHGHEDYFLLPFKMEDKMNGTGKLHLKIHGHQEGNAGLQFWNVVVLEDLVAPNGSFI